MYEETHNLQKNIWWEQHLNDTSLLQEAHNPPHSSLSTPSALQTYGMLSRQSYPASVRLAEM